MRNRLTLGLAATVTAAGLFLAACGSDSKSDSAAKTTAAPTSAAASSAPAAGAKDIVDTAVAAGSFTTLAGLLAKAGLVDTLKGAGPFTVFAPTDDAFKKVDAATLAKLAANPDALKQVLTYHVVPGKVMAADVKPGMVKTVEGSEATLKTDMGKVMIDGATVVKADVVASNGVIHVIDTVILPKDLKL